MRSRILQLAKHPLITGSGIVLAGSTIGNLFHFLFNLFMSQNLSVSDFGVLMSLSSLAVIPGLISTSITPSIVRFAGSYFAKNELSLVKDFFLKVTKSILIISVVIFVSFALFSQQISSFFHLQNNVLLLIVSGLMIGVGLVGTVNTAFLQAKLAFLNISFFNFFLGLSKFIIGVLLVTLGYGVFGSISALLAAGFIYYVLSLLPLRPMLKSGLTQTKIQISEVLFYAIPSAIAIFSTTAFTTFDILLVKHFFSPLDAGLYAGMSLLGKVIFFSSSPIATVMFPLIVQKHARQERYHHILLLSLLLVLLPSLVFTVSFFLVPEFVISFFLKKQEYYTIAPYIGLFSIYIMFYSVLTVLTNFFLSIKKTAIYLPLLIGVIAQIVLISLFHTNFLQIIWISITITGVLLLFFIGYYIKTVYIKD